VRFIPISIWFLAVLLVYAGCKKPVKPVTVNIVLDDTFKPPPPYIDDFPNEIGYKWIYYVMDTAHDYFDTLHVEISYDTTLVNIFDTTNNIINYKIWNYSYSIDDYSYFRCVEKNDSLAAFYFSDEYYFPGYRQFYVKFPLTVGDSLELGFGWHVTYVVRKFDTLKLFNGDKYLAYEILNHALVPPNDPYVIKIWYVEKIGIIRYQYNSKYGYGPINELISYDFDNKRKN
jgi:hypothetical protein